VLMQQQPVAALRDTLRPPSVDGDKKGHHATAITHQSDPNRRGTRARRGGDTSRTDPFDGSPAGHRFSNRSEENR
jgi:hypothetical protein